MITQERLNTLASELYVFNDYLRLNFRVSDAISLDDSGRAEGVVPVVNVFVTSRQGKVDSSVFISTDSQEEVRVLLSHLAGFYEGRGDYVVLRDLELSVERG